MSRIYGIRNGYVTNRVRPMCSGYGVFPGGKICKGCQDCGKDINKNPKTMKITRYYPKLDKTK